MKRPGEMMLSSPSKGEIVLRSASEAMRVGVGLSTFVNQTPTLVLPLSGGGDTRGNSP